MGSKKATAYEEDEHAAEMMEPTKSEIPPVKVNVVTLEDKILKQACSDIRNLLTSDWSQIYQAYRKAHIESGEEEFTFNIGLGVKLQPEMNDAKVTVKLSYSIKYNDETEPVMVSNQPDMFRA